MKAQKVVVDISVSTLDIASVKAMLHAMIRDLDAEVESGTLSMSDGDKVTWTTSRSTVEF